jgi:carboxypeptidase D
MQPRPRTVALASLALLVAVAAMSPVRAAGHGEPGKVFPVEVRLTERSADLARFRELDLDVDAVMTDRARLYVLDAELSKLRALGYDVEPIADGAPEAARAAALAPAPIWDPEAKSIPAAYHTYATLTSELQAIAAARPDLARLYSIGTSVQGRDLWMMKITRNPDLEEDEPEVRYIAAMHGDEVVGKELCVGLIHRLLDDYGVDPRITALVDSTEIWILPSMNPDGTEAGTRYNASGADLNRSFPDQFSDPVNSPAGRPPEVQAVMTWANTHSTNLSANFHGGSLVTNYPFDGNAAGTDVYSTSADDALLLSLSRSYADHNPPMLANNSDPAFVSGVCNGADWYTVRGGMQDWNYVWRGDVEVTIEQGNTKWPAASTLPQYWTENAESMLAYLERVHAGVRGVVTDAVTGAPLAATVKVVGFTLVGAPDPVSTDPDAGDYHRMLLPGTYSLEISSPGHVTAILDDVVVAAGGETRRDVALAPSSLLLRHHSHIVSDTGNSDGILDPGEDAALVVTLRNLGVSASSVSGRLVALSPYAGVTRAAASYGTIGANLTKSTASPHYGLSVSPATPAGHKLGFYVDWSAAGGVGSTEAFFLPTGPRTCTTFNATAVPRTISDRATATSTLSVSSPLEMDEINVFVNVAHPLPSDLTITVVSPSGTPVVLHDRSGTGANLSGWFDTDKPSFEPLDRLAGEPPGGTWTLQVYDGAPGNTGSLNGWSLQVCGRPFEATPPEVRLRGGEKRGANGVVTWWPYPGLSGYRVYRATSPSAAEGFLDVTAQDGDATDRSFEDPTDAPILYYIVTGVSSRGEGPWGHFGR